jgi:hypothetical protein
MLKVPCGFSLAAATMLVACGDDGGAPANVLPVEQPSVGGVWASGSDDDLFVLFVAEDGDLRFRFPDDSFGAGTVAVDGSGQLSGTLRRVVRFDLISPPPPFPLLPLPPAFAGPVITTRLGVEEQSCTVSGSVSTRKSLSATFTCLSPRGGTETQTYAFAYIAPAYVGPSTPDGLAGNYALQFSQQNMLNVNSNGEVFGTWDINFQRCTVNGRFSIIDGRFNLYRAEWTFGGCTGSRLRNLEGSNFTGFAQSVFTESKPNALYVLLTGPVSGRLDLISIVYLPQ